MRLVNDRRQVSSHSINIFDHIPNHTGLIPIRSNRGERNAKRSIDLSEFFKRDIAASGQDITDLLSMGQTCWLDDIRWIKIVDHCHREVDPLYGTGRIAAIRGPVHGSWIIVCIIRGISIGS